jgi:ABC-type polysaccharide/polyol phosphate export permease
MLGVADLVSGIDDGRVNHLMIAFFTTRGFWQPDQNSSSEHYRVLLSPFALRLAAARETLLGQLPAACDWIAAAAFALGGSIIALPIVGYRQRRIISWI